MTPYGGDVKFPFKIHLIILKITLFLLKLRWNGRMVFKSREDGMQMMEVF